MSYIGKSPTGTGVRIRYYFTQTSGGATSISGTDDNNKTLSFSDGEYVDVYLNGVSLVAGTDYNTTTANTIGGLSALANGDVVEVVVYDIFTVADTVSQSSGGTFSGNVVFSGTTTGLDLNGTELVLDADADTSITADTDDRIDFKTGGTDAMHIDGSQNVGIGTSSPQVALHVDDSSSSGKLRLSKGTVSSADDGVGSIQFRTGNTTAAANINGRTDASGTGNGAIQFSTGTTSSLNEAMRITSGGLVGIGTSSPSIQFEVVGNVVANYLGSFHNDGNDANRYVLRLAGGSDSGSGTSYLVGLQDGDFNSVGSITHSGGNASFNTSSDYRLKENVVDMTGAIARVKSLAPKRFNFIRNPDITVDGFIAHEAQTVVPGAVSGTHNGVETWSQQEIDDGHAPDGTSAGDNKLDGDGNTIPVMQGIDQSKLVPLLTGALKEAIAKIEALEARVTALEDA